MPLYYVQDDDRPGYVVADSYQAAEAKWLNAVSQENEGELIDSPSGITLLCKDQELIVDQDWLDPL